MHWAAKKVSEMQVVTFRQNMSAVIIQVVSVIVVITIMSIITVIMVIPLVSVVPVVMKLAVNCTKHNIEL